jgi:two-component system NtrC family sensor kinase
MVFTEKMASLGRLAAVVAHEINNPLAGILVSVKVLRRKLERLLPEEEGRAIDASLEMVQRETARSGDVVRNLLFFSRQSEPSLASENLQRIVERSLELVAHQAELSNVATTVEAAGDLEDLDCDGNQIQQACMVAILNSIDAMPDGGEILVRLRDCRDEHVCIEIQDTGCGIPRGLQLKVFEPFFSTKAEGEGTGLGLSVLYGIVRRHGGRVELESEEGRGTLVRMRLPRRPDPAAFTNPEGGL